MVNNRTSSLDATFSALADPTRRAILARLALGEVSVTEVAEPFAVSLPAISKHLRVLERAGLLRQERDGRVRRCCLEAVPMREAAEWIESYRSFWEQQLDALADYLSISGREEEPWESRSSKKTSSSTSGGRSRRRGRGSSGPGPTRRR